MNKKIPHVLLIIIILVIISIIYLVYPLVYPLESSNRKLYESFKSSTSKNKLASSIEYSCKFHPNEEYNDTRYTIIFNGNFYGSKDQIFDHLKIDKKLRNFYNRNNKLKSEKNQDELIIGLDSKKKSNKLYYSEKNNIYGLENKNNSYNYRIYKIINKFPKKKLDNLIGRNNSDKFYQLFNKNKLIESEDGKVYAKYIKDKDKHILQSYYIWLYPSKFKIGESKNKIIQLLEFYKCNTTNIDKWINKNKTKCITWIGLTKKNKSIEVTIYYVTHSKYTSNIYE